MNSILNRFISACLLCLALTPAWAVSYRKITVSELRDMLASLQQSKKSDDDIATELKKIELTEQLTTATMNSLGEFVNGPLSNEQIYVLQARSAILPPPPSDLPATAAPDSAAQQALLAKANGYVAKTYSQLPHLSATRMTARFQDGVEAIRSSSSMHEHIGANDDPIFDQTSLYIRLMNTHTDPVESQNGLEMPPAAKDNTKWGPTT